MLRIKPAIFWALGLALLTSCEKDLPTYLKFESYAFSSIDQNGGNWVPSLLSAATDIAVAAPSSANSAEYQVELSEVKALIAQASSQQRAAVSYWSNNPVVRWNEVALDLVAKYNLIPGPNEDGSYTLPNPAEPTGPPPFPFAHPPYASRALAYLSVAQFDGLIVAWHYKFLYNRAAPYRQDEGIPYAYVENDIPAYPSHGAVVATVSRAVLAAMFPLEKAYLEELEAEHLQSLLLSGENVASDLEAGQLIGQGIASIALARAAGDGMRNAQAPRAVSDSLQAAAFARFGWQWDNQEIPVRAVGLTPLFGQVKMWNVANVVDTRPAPPPAIGSPEYLADVEILKDYARNVTHERRRIANFWQDGLSTYTPPGHWNRIAKEFSVKYKLNPLRSARALAYMNMAIMDAGISCWDAKYYYHYPRPIQAIDGFKTILGTPNFPAYTSGHSAFSAAAAEVLAYVFPPETNQVRYWAEEAADSRLYGGIHWTFDATVGIQQGKNVALFTINRAKADGSD